MGEDSFEKFVIKNRGHFDDAVPSAKVWNNINRKLNGPSNNSHWWKVAAIVFFCTTTALLYNNIKPTASNNELVELEEFYMSQIDYKKSLVNTLDPNETSINNMDQQLQKLDAMYMVLKDEWKRKPSKEVLEALTLNLLVRLELLNEQLKSPEQPTSTNSGTTI